MNMFSLRSVGAALLFFITAIHWNTRLAAQTVSGSLVGTVLDASGSGLASAKVDAVNVATNVRASTSTSTAGAYQFANLPVGTYDVTASASGFTTSTLKGVAVALNQTATANVTLQVGSVSSTVDVSAAAAVIDTTTAQVQSTYEARQAQDLPTSSIGLGVINLSLLSAGVASNGGLGSGIGPSVGGQRPHENNFTIEGIDNNNKSVTGPLIYIPNDAVQSFTLLQNQFSPEYGHSAGGQFNTVVRSGTNELHGSVYEYLQNRNLNAVDQSLANQQIYSNPRYDQSRLGATIGGPILKNKLFYFGNFEYNPIGASATPAAATLTPTAAGYSMLAGLPGISKTNLGVLQQFVPPAPLNNQGTIQVGNAQIPIGVLPLASPNFLNSYYAVASVDYNISDKDQLRGRFIYNKQNGLNPNALAALPAFYVTSPSTFYLGTLTEYHNFTPSLTNEFRLGYNRYNNTTPAGNFTFPGLDQFPNIIIDQLSLDVGPYDNAPQFTIQNTYSAVDNVTWVKGNHTFTFGEEARKYIAPQQFTQRARGAYEYSSLSLYLQDLTPDQLAERTLGAPTYYGDQTAFYSYVNDVWRIRPNLTLNLGLRHEFTSVPFSERLQSLNAISSVPGLISFNKPQPQYTNFAPRIGIAYSPGTSGRTSIRAGFGMAYDVLFDNIGILELPPQFSTTVDSVGTVSNYLANGGIKPNAPVGPGLTQAQARAATSAFIPNQEVPYAITWNFGVQHVFANDYTLEVRYLGTRGVHLDVQQRINKQTVVTPTNSLPTYLSAPTQAQLDALPLTLGQLQSASNILPAYAAAGLTSDITAYMPVGNSSYNGLAVQLTRRFANGLQFTGSYTWSHDIDDSTADFFSTYLTPRRPQDFQNLRPERATSILDRRQRFTLAAIYDVPFYKTSHRWVMKNLVGNWEVAPIYTFESPESATVQSAADSNLNGDTIGDRTIDNLNGVKGTGSGVTPLKNSAGATVAYLANNPNAQYIVAGPGAYANGGRNTLATRRINSWDVSVVKRFGITERVRLELQGQFLNAFNHPQFTPGLLNQVNLVQQTGTGVKNYLTPGAATFNNPEATFSSNPRTIQVTAKIFF